MALHNHDIICFITWLFVTLQVPNFMDFSSNNLSRPNLLIGGALKPNERAFNGKVDRGRRPMNLNQQYFRVTRNRYERRWQVNLAPQERHRCHGQPVFFVVKSFPSSLVPEIIGIRSEDKCTWHGSRLFLQAGNDVSNLAEGPRQKGITHKIYTVLS